MSNGEINYTREQRVAINHRGGSLLVSAAAGSGKTRVLVDRILNRILNEGDDIDEFLVITYTRAAAFELRERIYDGITAKLEKDPGNQRLRKQLMLCRGATIDTIHTFCGEVLRENAHLVGLNSDFRVCDESESGLIKNEVINDLLDDLYQRSGEHIVFNSLIDLIIEGREDRYLIDVVFDIHSRLQSTSDPHKWIAKETEKLKQTESIRDVVDTVYGTYMIDYIKNTVEFYKNELSVLIAEMQSHPDFNAKYGESIEISHSQVLALLNSLELGWDSARANKDIEFNRCAGIKGYENLKARRESCKAELKKCAEILENSSAEHASDLRIIAPILSMLLNVVLEFDIAYAVEKRRRNIVDFSDLEHLTLSLLVDSNTKIKTSLANNIAKRFREILVDEYQDVNSVQEGIFTAISNNNSNIFMVGDVKQSIYRFRLADPSIFLSKYKSMREYNYENEGISSNDDSDVGVKIHLAKNFRSRPEVLETVNTIFTNIMSEPFGEMEYTEKERLIPGRKVDELRQGKQGIQGIAIGSGETTVGIPVEIDILDAKNLEKSDETDNLNTIQLEACHVASKINSMIHSGYKIPDSENGEREIRYSDIVILMRSVKSKAWRYASVLKKNGIPTNFPGGDSYFDTPEIATAISLLTVINNPFLDIPLAAVMSSMIYGFTATELAQIRLNYQGKTLYDSVIASADPKKGADEIACKCRKLIAGLDLFASRIPAMSADRFIWFVYNKIGVLDMYKSKKNGNNRCRNLILLAEYAKSYEQRGYKGIYMFLNHLNDLRERGFNITRDSESGGADSTLDDAVRIMSIHKSKGMEFPIVFLVSTAGRLNYQDTTNRVVFHSKLGIGASYIDKKRRIKYSTLPKIAIQRKLNDEMKSEELRILYVAMTRAREKLIVTGVNRNVESLEKKLSLLNPGKVPYPLMSRFTNMLEWILAGLQNENSDDFTIKYIDALDIVDASTSVVDTIGDINADSFDEKQSRETEKASLAQQNIISLDLSKPHYPNEVAVNLPSKLTVTKLKELAQNDDTEIASWLREKKIYRAPDFIGKEQKTTAIDLGVLMHLVIQHIELVKCADDDDVRNELERLKTAGLLTIEQMNEIDLSIITSFGNSKIAKRIVNSKKVKKEFKFSLLANANEYYPDSGDDEILLQGVVDCYFEEDGELVVVDYKTDKVTHDNVDERVERYKLQIDTYASALERITGKKVKERIIYFFALNKEVSV